VRPRYTWNMPGSLPPAVLLRPPEIEPEDNILGVGRVLATDGPDAPQQEDSFGGGWALGEVLRQRRRTGRLRTLEGEVTLWDVHRRGARQDDLLTKLIAETRLQARTLEQAAKKIRDLEQAELASELHSMHHAMNARLTAGGRNKALVKLPGLVALDSSQADEKEGASKYNMRKLAASWGDWRSYSSGKRGQEQQLSQHEEKLRWEHQARLASEKRYVQDKPHGTHLDLYDEMPMTLDLDEKPAVLLAPAEGVHGELVPDMSNLYALVGVDQSVKQRHLTGAFQLYYRRFNGENVNKLKVDKAMKLSLKQRYREYNSLGRKAGAHLLDEVQRAKYDQYLCMSNWERQLAALPRWMHSVPGIRQESWEWCWDNLWRAGSDERFKLVANVLDTVLLKGGEPTRWFFTSKEGYVKIKNSDSLKPLSVHSQWLKWHMHTPKKGLLRQSEGGEMGGVTLDDSKLALVLKKVVPGAALQRWREPAGGMYRTTLSRKRGSGEFKVQTDMLSLIGCDLKGGSKHAICEEQTRSVIVDPRFKTMSLNIAHQMQAVAGVALMQLVCEY